MIKFFRKIRYNLMENNKTGKYFKYAIGEIILVVVGILIALNINNWNEKRKAKITEFELYKVILTDIELDEEKIKDRIKYFKKVQSMQHHIYQETKGLAIYDSTLAYQELRPLKIFNLIVKDNYSEKYVMIKNDNVKNQLESYFKAEDYFKNAITDITTFKNEHLRPAFSRFGIHDTKLFFDNYQLDYFEIAEKNYINYSKLKQQYGTVELDQLLFNLGIKTSWALQSLKLIQEEGNKLKKSLENELK